MKPRDAAKQPPFRRLLPFLALVLLALPAAAQDSVPATQESSSQPVVSTAEEAAQLLQKTRDTADEMAEVTDRLKSAAGEDRVILRNRFDEMLDLQLTDLGRLVEIQAQAEKSGQDVTRLALETRQQLNRLSRRLRSHIRSLEEELATAAANRQTLSADEIELFEHRMAMSTGRLDGLYRSLITLRGDLIKSGAGAEEETAFLEERLTERGENLADLLEFTRKQLDQFREMRRRAPDNTQAQAQLFAAEERYDANRTSLFAAIHMMKQLGLDYSELEVRALEITGEVTSEALDAKVASGLVRDRLRNLGTYLRDNGPNLLARLITVVGIILAFWLLARLARTLARALLDRSRLATSTLLKQMILAWTGRLVLLLGLMIVLSQLGINLGPLLAGLGIAGFIVGFALQDSLANFAAGAMILAYSPFDVGDYIEAAGVAGQVKDMNLVSTRILTPDHQTLIVPNSKIWGDVIRNVTAQAQRRVDLVFGISYEDDIAQAEKVLQEVVRAHPKVLDDPAPVIKVHELNDSSVDFTVRPWARTEDYWDVHWDLTRAVKERFDQEGISIPYPQRDVHLIATAQDAGEEGSGSGPQRAG